MSKTKNQIIQEITDATIARLTPADTPEKISDEVTQDIEGYIVLKPCCPAIVRPGGAVPGDGPGGRFGSIFSFFDVLLMRGGG